MAIKKDILYKIEPLFPDDGIRELEDMSIELTAKANGLASQIHPRIRTSIGDLVRSMNCYYSNLIEGHNTHPRDIDRALKSDFSKEAEKRDLQLEAKAHIEVQEMIDLGKLGSEISSSKFIQEIHKEFCNRLPESLLWLENLDSGKKIKVKAGELRRGDVEIGKHIPPEHTEISAFLKRFEEGYKAEKLSKLKQILAIAASHHRLLWIHPFYDGNGRVTRLFSHAYLKHVGVGNSLWSVSRGLARRSNEYKALLMEADLPRRNDLDGRGNLSHEALVKFCKFFLEVCIDQVDFMSSLLEPKELMRRIERYCREEIDAKRLSKGSEAILREALLVGELERGRVAEITGFQSRKSTYLISELIEKGLLVSKTPKGKVTLGFPAEILEDWFPRLYQA